MPKVMAWRTRAPRLLMAHRQASLDIHQLRWVPGEERPWAGWTGKVLGRASVLGKEV